MRAKDSYLYPNIAFIILAGFFTVISFIFLRSSFIMSSIISWVVAMTCIIEMLHANYLWGYKKLKRMPKNGCDLSVDHHQYRPWPIIFQLFECLLLPYDIIRYLVSAYKSGGKEHGFGNFTVELRRRYGATLVYAWSIRNYFLHRLGVTLMDWNAEFFEEHYIEHEFGNANSARQYIHHFNPWISRMAKKYVKDHSDWYLNDKKIPKDLYLKLTTGPKEDLPLYLGLGFDDYVAERLHDGT